MHQGIFQSLNHIHSNQLNSRPDPSRHFQHSGDKHHILISNHLMDDDEAATSQVEYGFNTSYGYKTAHDSSRVTVHSVNITGLLAMLPTISG